MLESHHKMGCMEHKASVVRLPTEHVNDTIKFTNIHKFFAKPFVAYADIESLTSVLQNNEATNTSKYQHHNFCASEYVLINRQEPNTKPIIKTC
jgi:hypothetical protein